MTRQIPSFLLASCLAFVLHAGAQDNLPGNPQNPPGNPDCSDPLLANSSQCSAQNQNSMPLSPTAPTLQPGQNGSQQQPFFFDYRDNENLRQPVPRQPQQNLAPEGLTEFQKFVASTSGQVLPVYGANLFRQVPSTFAPLD